MFFRFYVETCTGTHVGSWVGDANFSTLDPLFIIFWKNTREPAKGSL